MPRHFPISAFIKFINKITKNVIEKRPLDLLVPRTMNYSYNVIFTGYANALYKLNGFCVYEILKKG